MSRIAEFLGGRFARDKMLFTGNRRKLTSVTVRGDQMAEELGGLCLRCKYLSDQTVASSPAIFWIVEPDLSLVQRFNEMTPQILDVINPASENLDRFYQRCSSFRFLLLNTASSINYVGPEPAHGWKTWVVPHHHCNTTGYRLPKERIEKPLTVGYVGQPEHLHDTEAIQSAVEKMGLKFLNAATTDLRAYEKIDIGVAWTQPEKLRDETRSNIKMVNFAAHGIPSVVCAYESYREADQALGSGATLIRPTLNDFIDGIRELAQDETLRQEMHLKALPAYEAFSIKTIGNQYRQIVEEATKEF